MGISDPTASPHVTKALGNMEKNFLIMRNHPQLHIAKLDVSWPLALGFAHSFSPINLASKDAWLKRVGGPS